MAGDWIRMRTDLYRDPKVIIMADLLLDEESDLSRHISQITQASRNVTRDVMRNAVIGSLVQIWGTVRHKSRRHGDDAIVYGAAISVVDDIGEMPGIGEAMVEVGWLRQDDKCLVFPDFYESHNSDSDAYKAKARERQRRYRERQKRDVTRDVTVTSRNAVEKEKEKEKREEEPPTPFEGVADTIPIFAAWDSMQPRIQAALREGGLSESSAPILLSKHRAQLLAEALAIHDGDLEALTSSLERELAQVHPSHKASHLCLDWLLASERITRFFEGGFRTPHFRASEAAKGGKLRRVSGFNADGSEKPIEEVFG